MDLQVVDLGVARGGLPILEGVSFVLGAGQVLVLRGPNGIGKTTLLRTIAGLQPAWKGSVSLDPEAVAYAAHADGLKATLSVRENLQFWARVYGTAEISSALAAFELASLIDRPAQNLSAGQKRRLGLARLLVTGRPLWVLDEPTVSLDASAVAMFANAVREHCSGGGSALIATHIDLGVDSDTLELAPFKATAPEQDDFDEAFL